MKRLTLLLAAALLAPAWLGGCGAQNTPPGDPPEHAELGSTVPLEQCRVGSYDELFTRTAGSHLRGGTAPEWRSNSQELVERGGRVWVGWAEGYGAEGAEAEQPIPRTWVACALPAAYNADIPVLSWELNTDWE